MSNHIKDTVQMQKSQVLINDYFIVKPGATEDQVTKAGAAEKPYGVAQVKQQLNQPIAGDNVEVAVYGGCYVKLGGNVSKGASVASDVNALGVAATTGQWAVGIADEDGVSGDIIAIRIFIHKA